MTSRVTTIASAQIDVTWHQEQVQAASSAARRCARFCDGIAVSRFVILLCGVLAAAAVAARPGAGPIIAVALMAAAWLLLALWHGMWIDRRDACRRRMRYHEHGAQRCADQWQHLDDPAIPCSAEHPFAHDLDLLGSQGLLARLDSCGSRHGSELLASWLLDPEQAWSAQRQEAVQALATRHTWRAAVHVAAAPRRGVQVSAAPLQSWLAQEVQTPSLLLRVAAIAASVVAVSAIVLASVALGLTAGLATALVAILVLSAWEGRRLQGSGLSQLDGDAQVDGLIALRHGLRAVYALNDDSHPRLAALAASAQQADHGLAAVGRLAAALARRANPLWTYGPGALLCAGIHLEQRFHHWGQQHRQHFSHWLQVLAEAEALASLATWAAEQPGTWPQLNDHGPLLAAENLQHPLLPRSQRIGNSCSLNQGQVLILTGANASGKSTWLRTLSLAVILARVGTTVPAQRLHLQKMHVATVMRVHDDLAAQRSRFQAEVHRLAQALHTATESAVAPLLVFDEILGGTNSQERHEGTRSIIRARLQQPGVVLLATHDLALAALAEEFPQQVQLAHFADTADADSRDLAFDYQLRSGVIASTNALRVMRAAGLPVDQASS
ncbi:MAG: hypothetical protein EA401_09640 [Planctomycetota bacterium]|nr:MAG: hypothetical protein EA401_09640 [Planctomycetota bacterium]